MNSLQTCEVGVTDQKLEGAQILSRLGDPSHGAQTLFLGVVRNHHLGKNVVAVSYDVFSPLAEKVFAEICAEAQGKWGPGLKIILIHRSGRLEVGEVSVAIAVGSAHRDEGYLASRYLLEELKVRAPIWKKEHYEEGESEWLRGHALCHHSDRVAARSSL